MVLTPGNLYTQTTRMFYTGYAGADIGQPFPGARDARGAHKTFSRSPRTTKRRRSCNGASIYSGRLPWKIFLTVGYVGSKTSHLDTLYPTSTSRGPSTNTDLNSRASLAGVHQSRRGEPATTC